LRRGYDFRVSALRLTIVAAVSAAFLITPAALLADEPATVPAPAAAPGSSPPTAPEVEAGTTATAVPSGAGEASLQTSSKPPTARSERAAPPRASAVSVTIGDFFFKPKVVTISVGQSITWTNEGKVKVGHTVTGNGFDSGILKTGATYTHRFSAAGTFDYVCTIHPNMRGTVTVTASSGGGGNASGGGETGGSSGSTNGATGGLSNDATSNPSGTGSSSGGSLASTGLNLVLLAEIGICLIATGMLVRRLTCH
jgi:plastocyanin